MVHSSRVLGWPRHSEESFWHSPLKGTAAAVQLPGPSQQVVQLSALILPVSCPRPSRRESNLPYLHPCISYLFPEALQLRGKAPSREGQGPVNLDFELLTPLWPGCSWTLPLPCIGVLLPNPALHPKVHLSTQSLQSRRVRKSCAK